MRRCCCGWPRSRTCSPATSTTRSPATILIGSVPGVWIGTLPRAAVPGGLRLALGVVLFASGLALLGKAGVDIPAAVLIGIPLLLAVGCAATCACADRRSPA